MKTWIITHTDLDGFTSAAIVKHYYNYHNDINIILTSYNRDFSFLNKINDNDTVILLDFSFDLDIMRSLNRRTDFTWIDHHLIIKEAEKQNFNPKGNRSTDYSAAMLAWRYYHPNDLAPRFVQLVNDYDLFKFQLKDTKAFYYGVSGFDMRPYEYNDTRYKNLLTELDNTFLNTIIKKGSDVYNYLNRIYELNAKQHVFKTKLKNYNVIASNCVTGNSFVFNHVNKHLLEECDAVCVFNWVEKNKTWKFSVYNSGHNTKEVHHIAKAFGGGGHCGAGGFSLPQLPKDFLIEPTKKEIPYKGIDFIHTLTLPVQNFINNNFEITAKLIGTTHNISDYNCFLINNYQTELNLFANVSSTLFDVVGYYIYLNNGTWRVILYPVVYNVDMKKLSKKFNAKEISNDGIIFYLESLDDLN